MVVQEIINNHRTIPIPAEMSHMMKSIQNKIVSGTMKKLQKTNSRDSDRSRSSGFRMNQNQVENTHWVEEQTNYCNALTNVFRLNF